MLTERLALLVSLNPASAVKGLDTIGKAADRNLSKTEAGLTRTGLSLQKFGAAAAVTGGLATFGLARAAKASERAHLSFLKLENSLQNNPRLAGQTSKSYVELADAIQAKTAAENDSIVEGMAMLGTFRVTGQQIKELTPLVVDYARKFGVDLVTANKQVGKALDGNIGALKRNGVTIDAVLYKTDHYAAVQKALNQQVGGFAEAEGKTFSGSLERLKNQLGDLEESVGKGAVDAFSSMIGGTIKAASALNGLSGGSTEAAGKIATFAAVGLTAAGGLSFLVGKAITLRASIAALPSRVGTLTSGLSGLGATALGVGANIGILAVAMQLLGQAGHANIGELQTSLTGLASTGKVTGAAAKALGGDFGDLAKAVARITDPSVQDRANDFSKSWARALGNTTDDLSKARNKIHDLDEALAAMAQSDPAGAAAALKAIRDALPTKVGDKLVGLLKDYKVAAEDAAGATSNLGAAAGDAVDPIKALGTAVDAALAPFDGLAAVDKAMSDMSGIHKYFEGVDKDLKDATERVRKSKQDLQDLLNEPLDTGDQEKIAGKQRYLEFLMRKPAGQHDEQWQHEVDVTRQAIALAQTDLSKAATDRANRIRDARDAVKTAEKDQQDAYKATSRTLDGNSDAAIKNRGLVIGAAKDVGDAIKTLASDGSLSAQDLTTIDSLVEGFVKNTKDQFTGGTDLIDSFANALKKIPTGDLQVTLTVKPGDDFTKAFLDRLFPPSVVIPTGGFTPTAHSRAFASGGLVPDHLAYGGFPGAPRGTDTVPAWLTPGEFVLNKKSASMLGPGMLHALNAGRVPRSMTNNVVINNPAPERASVSLPRELRSLAFQAGLN